MTGPPHRFAGRGTHRVTAITRNLLHYIRSRVTVWVVSEPTSTRHADEVKVAWGQILRAKRLDRRMHQSEVAGLASLSQVAVSNAENGRASLATIFAVAAVLDVELIPGATP